MMLNLTDGMPFRSCFACKILIPDAFSSASFCVDGVTPYLSSEEKCRDFNLSKEQKVELVLDAPAIIRYFRPQMSKSWHFVSHDEVRMLVPGDTACVWLNDTYKQANLLVAESGENTAPCLLAQPYAVIAGRAMQLGDVIRIMNGRLKP